MKKTKVETLPSGKKEVVVTVEPATHASPMIVEVDLDALRDTVARTNDPRCSPDAAVKMVEQKIAAGEIDRLYTAMLDEYVRIAPKEANGDALGFIEMEFLAIRQIMDDEVPDFRPEIHEDILSVALSFKVMMRVPVAEETRGRKRASLQWLRLPTPLVRMRNDAINAIRLAILAAASRARRIGSESYRLWRDALEVIALVKFTADGAMERNGIKRLVESLRAANLMLYLDAAIADYVPLNADGGEEPEARDVL